MPRVVFAISPFWPVFVIHLHFGQLLQILTFDEAKELSFMSISILHNNSFYKVVVEMP